MRRLLLRAAVITGGCAAGILISLSISGTAHADDRPHLLGGLSDTVTGVVDEVLPDRPGHQPDQPPDDRPDDHPGRGDDRPPATRPVEDIVDEVIDEAEETVDDVIDTVTPPTAEPPASDEPTQPQPDIPIAAPDVPTTTSPLPGVELPDLLNPTPAPEAIRQAPPADLGEVYELTTPLAHAHACGEDRRPGWRDESTGQRHMRRIAIEQRAAPAAPSYRQPAPRPPSGPGDDATPAVGAPCTAYTGLYQDATLTARASMPRTTAVRIPGRDQAADGKTRRPDAPSG